MHLTANQREIIKIVEEGNLDLDGERYCDVDLDQILARVSYQTTKESLQFSIRSLIKKDMIGKGERDCRRGKSRQTFHLTKLAKITLMHSRF